MFSSARKIIIGALALVGTVIALVFNSAQPSQAAGSDDFILTYSVAANGKVHMYLGGTVTAITVDWGDSTTTGPTSSAGYVSHTYTSAGTYTVTISGTALTAFGNANIGTYDWYSGGTSQASMRTVSQWGTLGLTSLSYAFTGATGLTSIAALPASVTDLSYAFSNMGNSSPSSLDISGLGTANVTNMAGTFSGNYYWNPNIDSWNTSSVTNMSSMFERNYYGFNRDISAWNVSNVTNMSSMFKNAQTFNKNIGAWTTSSLTNMSSMFYNANAFNNGGSDTIKDWDTADVTDMSSLFEVAIAFNQPLTNWNTASVTTMASMFSNAQAFNKSLITSGNYWNTGNVTTMNSMFYRAFAFNGALTGWDTSKVTNMADMFRWATVFNQDITAWDVSSVTTMYEMFRAAEYFNQEIGSWDTSAVTTMEAMFKDALRFNQALTSGVVGDWSTASVTNMANMFASAIAFNKDISTWDTSNVTTMAYMFDYATAFNNGGVALTKNGSSWDTGSVTTFYATFQSARVFNQDITNWDVSAATTMAYMFSGAWVFNQDISIWDTSSVTNMSYMFANADDFVQNLPQTTVGDWSVSNVTNMEGMFYGADLYNQSVQSWDTAKVTNMAYMFKETPLYNQPMVQTTGQWVTTAVTTMSGMFESADALTQDISSWNTGNVLYMNNMFAYTNLFNVNISIWDVSKVQTMAGMFAGSVLYNQPVEPWNTVAVTNMSSMFEDAKVFNQTLSSGVVGDWTTANVIYMSSMFKSADVFNQPLASWDTSKVLYMDSMFSNSVVFNKPIEAWDTSKVVDMSYMFYSAIAFDQELNEWDTSSVTNMEGMFKDSYVFNRDLYKWNVSQVLNFKYMFDGADVFNGDLEKWTRTGGTWAFASNAWTFSGENWSLDGWVPQSGQYFNAMFANSVFNKPIGSWDTRNAVDFSYMFAGNDEFNQPMVTDGNIWKASGVTNFTHMFYDASAWNMDVSSWSFSSMWRPYVYWGDGGIFGASGQSDAHYTEFLKYFESVTPPALINMSSPAQYFCSAKDIRELLDAWSGATPPGKEWSFSDGGLAVADCASDKTEQEIDFTDPVDFALNRTVDLQAVSKVKGEVTETGLEATFSVISGPCVITGTELSATAEGVCVIAANQSGSDVLSPTAVGDNGYYDAVQQLHEVRVLPVHDSSVTYHANALDTSGVLPSDSSTYSNGDTVTTEEKGTLAREGFTFGGWNTEEDGTGTTYDPTDNATKSFVIGDQDVDLYAVWVGIDYDITVDPGNGSSTTTITYNKGDSVNLPANPSRGGYTFDGWYDQASGGTLLTSPWSPSGIGAKSIYAYWTPMEWDVTYDVQGGTPEQLPTTYLTDGSFALPVVNPTKSGFTFTGWFIAASGGSAVANPYSPAEFGDLTLFAQWRSNSVPEMRTKIYAFRGHSALLTPKLKRLIKAFVKGKGEQTLTCIGQTRGRVINPYTKALAKKRAIAACKYAKTINRQLTTKIKVEPAAGRTYKNRSVRLIMVAPTLR